MGVFQKVGNWLTDRNDRFIRDEVGSPASYYASSEAESVYSRMGGETSEEMEDIQNNHGESGRYQKMDPFERPDKYGGRIPYRSQKDIQAQQADFEAGRQRLLMEEQVQGFAEPRPPIYTPVSQSYSTSANIARQDQAQPHQSPKAQSQPPYAGAYMPPQHVQPNNVVMFPGTFQTPDGGAYTHTEHVVLLRSRNECKNIIEYIKANASVFLNMEFIASDAERQRCVDMLSGAAYTLGCHLNKISPRGIYLISAPTVYVVIDSAMQKVASASETQYFARAGYETGIGMNGRQSYTYQQGAREVAQQTRDPATQAVHANRYGQLTENMAASPYAEARINNTAGSYPYALNQHPGNTDAGNTLP